MARTYPPTRGPWVFYSIQVLEILQHRTTALIDISQICPSTTIPLPKYNGECVFISKLGHLCTSYPLIGRIVPIGSVWNIVFIVDSQI